MPRDDANADLTKGNQLRLAVAEYRRALLVTYLFMWCGDRTKDVRRYAVNWDIGDVMLPHGGFQTMCWPQSQKTGFCKEATIGFNSGVGKIRNTKVASLCQEDLRYDRPVLMHGLGSKARCGVTSRALRCRGTLLHTYPLVLVQQLSWEVHKAEPGACAGCYGAGAEWYFN